MSARVYLVAGGVAVAVLAGLAVYIKKRGAAGLVRSAITTLDSVAGEAVQSVGETIGIPRTDAELCAKAKVQGDGWGASKYCSAGDFLRYMWGREAQPDAGARAEIFVEQEQFMRDTSPVGA